MSESGIIAGFGPKASKVNSLRAKGFEGKPPQMLKNSVFVEYPEAFFVCLRALLLGFNVEIEEIICVYNFRYFENWVHDFFGFYVLSIFAAV